MINAKIALTILATVKDELNISVSDFDNRLERYINQASQHILNLLDRQIVKTIYENDLYSGTDTESLMLREYPIRSIEKIEVNETELVIDEGYKITLEGKRNGSLYRIGMNWIKANRTFGLLTSTFENASNLTIKVDYIAGYVTPQQVLDGETETRDLPEDLEALAIELVAIKFNKQCLGMQGQENYSAGKRKITWGKVINEDWQNIINIHKRKWM